MTIYVSWWWLLVPVVGIPLLCLAYVLSCLNGFNPFFGRNPYN